MHRLCLTHAGRVRGFRRTEGRNVIDSFCYSRSGLGRPMMRYYGARTLVWTKVACSFSDGDVHVVFPVPITHPSSTSTASRRAARDTRTDSKPERNGHSDALGGGWFGPSARLGGECWLLPKACFSTSGSRAWTCVRFALVELGSHSHRQGSSTS
jgi:hypothetical protein